MSTREAPEPTDLPELPELHWTDLGRQPYRSSWALQRALVEEHKAGRGCDRLLLVEHDPVLTLGRRADPEHVLIDAGERARRGIELIAVERGGDVTWHGPGQLVAYPILDLRGFRRDVRWYSGALSEAVVRCLDRFGIAAEAREGPETGVWVRQDRDWCKIAALGVRIERWISYHGIALNIAPDLSAYDMIVPCGLAGARSTSVVDLLGRPVEWTRVRAGLVEAFGQVLDRRMVESPASELPEPNVESSADPLRSIS